MPLQYYSPCLNTRSNQRERRSSLAMGPHVVKPGSLIGWFALQTKWEYNLCGYALPAISRG